MKTIIILIIILLVGCSREYILRPIDGKLDGPIFIVDPGHGSDHEDDTEVIQAALNEHGIVHLPIGIWHINSTLVFSANNMRLLGEGYTGRYPDTSCFGSAIIIGDNVTTVADIYGSNTEIRGFMFTGNALIGDNLERIIQVNYGSNNNDFTGLFVRDITNTEFTSIEFAETNNSSDIEEFYCYDGKWAVRTLAPTYNLTMKDFRIYGTDNGIQLGGNQTSFSATNGTVEQIEGPAFHITSNNWCNFRFENIHNEWAWPLILNDAVHRPIISINNLYGWGYEGEEINLIETTSNKGAYVNVKNSVLYNLRGYNQGDEFPIKEWAKYSYGITLDNVKIKDDGSHKYRVWNKFPSKGLEALTGLQGLRLLIHTDQYIENDTLIKVYDQTREKYDWSFDDSTQLSFDGDWSYLSNSDGFFVIIAEPNHFNTHKSILLNTGSNNGIQLYFHNAKFWCLYRKNGSNVGAFYQNGYPEGLTQCIVVSQRVEDDSLHLKMVYDNFEGYSHVNDYDMLEKKFALSDLPESADHGLKIGNDSGLSIDGDFTLIGSGTVPLEDSEMYEIVYSMKKYWNWQHSNKGLF
jgi:hypothetical protein